MAKEIVDEMVTQAAGLLRASMDYPWDKADGEAMAAGCASYSEDENFVDDLFNQQCPWFVRDNSYLLGAASDDARRGFIYTPANSDASTTYCATPPTGDWDGVVAEWEFLASEWGVRFTYAVGSFCFIVGAILAFPEALADD